MPIIRSGATRGRAGVAIARVEREREEVIRETAHDQDIGASEEAIEYESKRAVMYRWVIGIGLIVLFVALIGVFVWYVTA
jgi:uncharacterized membrane protein YukC